MVWEKSILFRVVTWGYESSIRQKEDGGSYSWRCWCTAACAKQGVFIPQPTLKKIPVAQLQGGCARFVWVPHQNKARHSWNLTAAVEDLAVAPKEAGNDFRLAYGRPPACLLVRAGFV